MKRERDAEHGKENLKSTHLASGDHDFSLVGCSGRKGCVSGVKTSRKGVMRIQCIKKKKSEVLMGQLKKTKQTSDGREERRGKKARKSYRDVRVELFFIEIHPCLGLIPDLSTEL